MFKKISAAAALALTALGGVWAVRADSGTTIPDFTMTTLAVVDPGVTVNLYSKLAAGQAVYISMTQTF